jgi:hypothetical protein
MKTIKLLILNIGIISLTTNMIYSQNVPVHKSIITILENNNMSLGDIDMPSKDYYSLLMNKTQAHNNATLFFYNIDKRLNSIAAKPDVRKSYHQTLKYTLIQESSGELKPMHIVSKCRYDLGTHGMINGKVNIIIIDDIIIRESIVDNGAPSYHNSSFLRESILGNDEPNTPKSRLIMVGDSTKSRNYDDYGFAIYIGKEKVYPKNLNALDTTSATDKILIPIENMSAEGGSAIGYYNKKGHLQLIELELMGESYKRETLYFIKNNQLLLVYDQKHNFVRLENGEYNHKQISLVEKNSYYYKDNAPYIWLDSDKNTVDLATKDAILKAEDIRLDANKLKEMLRKAYKKK